MTDIHALAGAYVLDAVSDIERAAFSRHLADCETCALEVAELRETVARLADQTWSVPPPRMRAEVLAQIRRTPQLPPGGVARPEGWGGSGRWRQWTIAAAAAGVVAAGAGAGAWEIQEERVRQERATAEAERLRADEIRAVLAAPDAVLRTEGVAGGGRVTVVASASRDRAVAVLSGLAEPGPGRAYQLWLLDGTGARSSGVLPAGETTTTMLIDGVRGRSRFGVTEEPAGGSAQPTTTPVVLMPVT